MNREVERTEAVVRALAELRHACAIRSVPLEEREAVMAALADLHRAVAEHAAASEAPDALLAEVGRDAPRLSHAVARSVGEHATLIDEIDALREATAVGAPLPDVWRRADLLAAAVDRHLSRVVGIVYDAYTTDTGDADA